LSRRPLSFKELQWANGLKAGMSIYSAVAEKAQEKIKANHHWRAKIRQVLQKHASNVESGVWALRKAA